MYDGIVQDLIDEFGRLPVIGPKSAQRITFHILQSPSFDVSLLAQLLAEVREKVRFCEICGNVSEQDQCGICRDPRRNPAVICVVEDATDAARAHVATLAPPREGDVLPARDVETSIESDDDGDEMDAVTDAPVPPVVARPLPTAAARPSASGAQRYGEAVVRQVLGARFVREEPYEPPTRFN